MKNSKVYKIISAIFSILLLVGSVSQLPSNLDKQSFIIFCMVITVLSSAFETYFSPKVPNSILWMQIVGAIGFTAGGLLDHFDVFHFSEVTTEWVRFSLVIIWKVSDFILKEFK